MSGKITEIPYRIYKGIAVGDVNYIVEYIKQHGGGGEGGYSPDYNTIRLNTNGELEVYKYFNTDDANKRFALYYTSAECDDLFQSKLPDYSSEDSKFLKVVKGQLEWAEGGQGGGYEPDNSTIQLTKDDKLQVVDYVSASDVQGSVNLLQQSIRNLDAKKQDTLTAGQNIIIRDNVISASGTVSVDFANLTGSPFDNQALSKELTYLKDKVAELETIVANCAKLDADNVFTGYNKFVTTAPKVVTGDYGVFSICKNDNDSKTPSISIQPQKNVNEYTTLYINAYAHPGDDFALTLPNKSGMIATLDDIEQLKKELQENK